MCAAELKSCSTGGVDGKRVRVVGYQERVVW